MYVAWNIQTIGLCFPMFLQQGDKFLLTILRQILTPQEVVDWFGCGNGNKKKMIGYKGKVIDRKREGTNWRKVI